MVFVVDGFVMNFEVELFIVFVVSGRFFEGFNYGCIFNGGVYVGFGDFVGFEEEVVNIDGINFFVVKVVVEGGIVLVKDE